MNDKMGHGVKSFTAEELQDIGDRADAKFATEYNREWKDAYLVLREAAEELQRLTLETYHPEKTTEKTLTININNPEGLEEWVEQTLIPKIVKIARKDVSINKETL